MSVSLWWKKYLKTGECLVQVLKLDRPGKGTPELQKELISLSGGRKSSVRTYYAGKICICLAVLTVGFVLALICGISFWMISEETVIEELVRPGYGEGDRTEYLHVSLEGEETVRELEIKVAQRSYTDQEEEELLDAALAELEQVIRGENESLDEVRSDLNLPESLQDGAVQVNWISMPYGIVDAGGRLTGAEDENGMLVELQGTLTCGDQEAVHTVFAQVFPPIQGEEERLQDAILKEVEQADLRDSHEASMQLPVQVDGRGLIWSRSSRNPFPVIFLLTLIAAACIYIQMDNEVHKRAEERKQQLLLDYPDLMWKMTMLLGAGLSIRGTFMRISEEYLREKKQIKVRGGKEKRSGKRYVYEEVACTCMEMQSGISEAHAYERFGKRCQLPEYIRLGTVLSQNLKKGSKGLVSMLETEAEASLLERRNHARKIGEQAGTRLLLPMILMLGVVLAVLMVPAFMSF